MTPKGLAKLLVAQGIGPLQVDTYIDILFPDFNKYFASEQSSIALAFAKKYLADCRVSISGSNVQIIRDERIPGVGEYPHMIGYAEINNQLAASILAASLFAYDYLNN
jgi:hypothetical protein